VCAWRRARGVHAVAKRGIRCSAPGAYAIGHGTKTSISAVRSSLLCGTPHGVRSRLEYRPPELWRSAPRGRRRVGGRARCRRQRWGGCDRRHGRGKYRFRRRGRERALRGLDHRKRRRRRRNERGRRVRRRARYRRWRGGHDLGRIECEFGQCGGIERKFRQRGGSECELGGFDEHRSRRRWPKLPRQRFVR